MIDSRSCFFLTPSLNLRRFYSFCPCPNNGVQFEASVVSSTMGTTAKLPVLRHCVRFIGFLYSFIIYTLIHWIILLSHVNHYKSIRRSVFFFLSYSWLLKEGVIFTIAIPRNSSAKCFETSLDIDVITMVVYKLLLFFWMQPIKWIFVANGCEVKCSHWLALFAFIKTISIYNVR